VLSSIHSNCVQRRIKNLQGNCHRFFVGLKKVRFAFADRFNLDVWKRFLQRVRMRERTKWSGKETDQPLPHLRNSNLVFQYKDEFELKFENDFRISRKCQQHQENVAERVKTKRASTWAKSCELGSAWPQSPGAPTLSAPRCQTELYANLFVIIFVAKCEWRCFRNIFIQFSQISFFVKLTPWYWKSSGLFN